MTKRRITYVVHATCGDKQLQRAIDSSLTGVAHTACHYRPVASGYTRVTVHGVDYALWYAICDEAFRENLRIELPGVWLDALD